ncbi:MAG: hypothetical protein WDN06_09820 [Asticcacaulis sp.]
MASLKLTAMSNLAVKTHPVVGGNTFGLRCVDSNRAIQTELPRQHWEIGLNLPLKFFQVKKGG